MLTAREVQIIAGVARGKTNAEIAVDLGVNTMTVKSHLANALSRAGHANNRIELVSWAYRKGYLSGLPSELPDGFQVPEMTDRQMEVLTYVVRGCDIRGIGKKMFVTPDTARTHVRIIMKKWKARNRQHLTALAWQAGLVGEHWFEAPPAAETVNRWDRPRMKPIGDHCPTCGTNLVPKTPRTKKEPISV